MQLDESILLMVQQAKERTGALSQSTIRPISSQEPGKGRRRPGSMPHLSVMSVLVLLVVFVSACGGTSTSTSQATSPAQLKKHDTCAVQATLPADIPPSGSLDTGANVIAAFNNARQQEGCAVPLSIDPAQYDGATPQVQAFMLLNAERQDRGLPPFQLDTTLLSQIAQNHSQELVDYKYFGHSSPINQPGGKSDPESRLQINPLLKNVYSCCAEGIAGASTVAGGIYSLMYQDASNQWGQRDGILGYISFMDNNPGHWTWIGIGVATGGKYGVYTTIDYLQDLPSAPYTPPAQVDTTPPTMNPPTVVDANTVQVTGVKDDSDGRTDGVAGVTSVVFSVGSAVAADGTFQTVSAKQTSPGTWTANMAVTDPTQLHAVAVDGSGNYTDINANGSGAGGATPTPTPSASNVKGSSLATGAYLATNDYLVSANGLYFVIMQSDGNLVIYHGSDPAHQGAFVWNSGSGSGVGGGAYFVIMQSDGNLVIYHGSDPAHQGAFVWNSGSGSGAGGNVYSATLQNDGHLVITTGTTVVWTT